MQRDAALRNREREDPALITIIRGGISLGVGPQTAHRDDIEADAGVRVGSLHIESPREIKGVVADAGGTRDVVHLPVDDGAARERQGREAERTHTAAGGDRAGIIDGDQPDGARTSGTTASFDRDVVRRASVDLEFTGALYRDCGRTEARRVGDDEFAAGNRDGGGETVSRRKDDRARTGLDDGSTATEHHRASEGGGRGARVGEVERRRGRSGQVNTTGEVVNITGLPAQGGAVGDGDVAGAGDAAEGAGGEAEEASINVHRSVRVEQAAAADDPNADHILGQRAKGQPGGLAFESGGSEGIGGGAGSREGQRTQSSRRGVVEVEGDAAAEDDGRAGLDGLERGATVSDREAALRRFAGAVILQRATGEEEFGRSRTGAEAADAACRSQGRDAGEARREGGGAGVGIITRDDHRAAARIGDRT